MSFTNQNTIYKKTEKGVMALKARDVLRNQRARALLIMIDGKRNNTELSKLVVGENFKELIAELIDSSFIEPNAAASATNVTHTNVPTLNETSPQESVTMTAVTGVKVENVFISTVDSFLERLPDPSTRSAKDTEMARNFMTNTINTIFQPYTRLTLLEAIAKCKSAQEARVVYVSWAETMASSTIGSRRMPEFREKLAPVL